MEINLLLMLPYGGLGIVLRASSNINDDLGIRIIDAFF